MKIRCLLAYEHYPVSMAYFFKLGFRDLGCHVDSIGHCTKEWIPWDKGMILKGYSDEPTYPLKSWQKTYLISEPFKKLASKYDLFINIDAGHYWKGSLSVPKIIIGTDPHTNTYEEQRKDCDLFICMQKYYSRPGDKWLPYAHQPSIHYHLPNEQKRHDITFIGVLYPKRRYLLELLAKRYKVFFSLGILYKEATKIYNQGEIAFNLSAFYDLPLRFFEGMAYKNLVITNRVPDLEDLECKEDIHYVAYSNEEELLSKVEYYLSHKEEMKRIQENGYQFVKRHTFKERARKILEWIGLLK